MAPSNLRHGHSSAAGRVGGGGLTRVSCTPARGSHGRLIFVNGTRAGGAVAGEDAALGVDQGRDEAADGRVTHAPCPAGPFRRAYSGRGGGGRRKACVWPSAQRSIDRSHERGVCRARACMYYTTRESGLGPPVVWRARAAHTSGYGEIRPTQQLNRMGMGEGV